MSQDYCCTSHSCSTSELLEDDELVEEDLESCCMREEEDGVFQEPLPVGVLTFVIIRSRFVAKITNSKLYPLHKRPIND